MRILILGGDGMLGHQLVRMLSPAHTVHATLRGPRVAYDHFGLFSHQNASFGVDVTAMERLVEITAGFHPDTIINAVGIVKQRSAANHAIASLEINALLPHRCALLADAVGARFIHISTDCVFEGTRGGYAETDIPDAKDLYGRSKLLGEVVDNPNSITLRTSIVGRELGRRQGLLEWFLAQRGPVKGFSHAIFSGLTTKELSRVIERVITDHRQLTGLYHVSGAPIDKESLLRLFGRALHPSCRIEHDDALKIDRSLDSTAFRLRAGYCPPSWADMVEELAADAEFYNQLSL
jgi:dTDP-4-dehydrorhamnose reductase